LHDDTQTIVGTGLENYTKEPCLEGGAVAWRAGAGASLNEKILAPVAAPFQPTGGLARLSGNLGTGVMKISAVSPDHHQIEAPCAVFETQDAVKAAFKAGTLDRDVVVVVRFQGPKANGMPELHGLTPALSVLQGRGFKVALVTDGRMSGASGKVPAAIHVSPEALDGGGLARLCDGDVVRVDAVAGTLEVLDGAVLARPAAAPAAPIQTDGCGRDMFSAFRAMVGSAETGARVV
jgi:phosphogluconate dehydratase